MQMLNHISFLVVLTTTFSLLTGCGSSGNPKKKIADEITHSSCEFASEITSAFFNVAVNATLNQLTDGNVNGVNTGNLGSIPGYWCECYTYYVSKDLVENFSMSELKEIRNDKFKRFLVLSKLFQAHQSEISECISTTTDLKIKNYADFERKLNRKLKSK